jgi:hypothetical protein
MDYKIILGAIAAIISIVSYIPYIRNVILGKTKPHLFTWIIWSIMSTTAFAAQLSAGAFAGSWSNGVTGLICIAVAILAIKKGEKDILVFDKICFALSIIALILWGVTKSALLAIILITIADILAFTITFVKAYRKPHEETISTFGFAAIKHVIAIGATRTYSFTTLLFPVYLVIYNTVYVITIFLRRRYLTKHYKQTN